MPEEVWTFMALGLILFFTGVLVGYNWRQREMTESLQDRIFKWGMETFGEGQRQEGVFAHLLREITELGDNLANPEELADCAILLFELAGFAGVDLIEEVEKKFKINRGRKWGAIEPDGSILHIKEETT